MAKSEKSEETTRSKKPGGKYGTEAIRDARLETWPNPSADRDYEIAIDFPEFTCLCPRSGYPDFATIRILYVPDRLIVELKALKLYLNGYRDVCISHEAVTNLIFDDLTAALSPRFLEVAGDFNPRGNVKTVIRVASGPARAGRAKEEKGGPEAPDRH